MDVTPTPKMFKVMRVITNAACGEEPLAVEKSSAAEARRALRGEMMNVLHRLIHLAMREGAARANDPDPLKHVNLRELGEVLRTPGA